MPEHSSNPPAINPLVEPRWRILGPADFKQLKKRARELQQAYADREKDAVALYAAFHPAPPPPGAGKLSDAQLTLARAYDYPSWPRLNRAVALFNAMCADDVAQVMALIRQHPRLLLERVNGVTSNWGPPLACAAQIGAEKVFQALIDIPGQDVAWAMGRAILKGRKEMARALLSRGVKIEPGEAMGPCESLNVEGLRFLAEIGHPLTDEKGDAMAPVGLLLEGYHRNPPAKHACLAFFAEQGIDYPDTPIMAFHLGRLDLLEEHLRTDPNLLQQRFSYREIYPLTLGCHEDESLGLHGAPLGGTTLLHMAVDFDEWEMARWLIENGADANADALADADGFGGHTPLFNAVVSQAYLVGRQRDAAMTRLLLDNGADWRVRASLRKGIRFIADESVHEYRNVTALKFGEAFHGREWVNVAAMEEIRTRQQQ